MWPFVSSWHRSTCVNESIWYPLKVTIATLTYLSPAPFPRSTLPVRIETIATAESKYKSRYVPKANARVDSSRRRHRSRRGRTTDCDGREIEREKGRKSRSNERTNEENVRTRGHYHPVRCLPEQWSTDWLTDWERAYGVSFSLLSVRVLDAGRCMCASVWKRVDVCLLASVWVCCWIQKRRTDEWRDSWRPSIEARDWEKQHTAAATVGVSAFTLISAERSKRTLRAAIVCCARWICEVQSVI